MDIIDRLVNRGAKAVVIACNTATSAVAQQAREKYPYVPIVGVEPAVKPAAMKLTHKKVLVMATPQTLAREKYKNLASRFEEQAPDPAGLSRTCIQDRAGRFRRGGSASDAV